MAVYAAPTSRAWPRGVSTCTEGVTRAAVTTSRGIPPASSAAAAGNAPAVSIVPQGLTKSTGRVRHRLAVWVKDRLARIDYATSYGLFIAYWNECRGQGAQYQCYSYSATEPVYEYCDSRSHTTNINSIFVTLVTLQPLGYPS